MMLIGELAQRTNTKKSTLDRYVRFQLVPCRAKTENDYREFGLEAIPRVELIRKLGRRPFRLTFEQMRAIFATVPSSDLETAASKSDQALKLLLAQYDV